MLLAASSEKHNAYFYKRRVGTGSNETCDLNLKKTLLLPAFCNCTTSKPVPEEEVLCDPCFYEGIKIAIGREGELKKKLDGLAVTFEKQPNSSSLPLRTPISAPIDLRKLVILILNVSRASPLVDLRVKNIVDISGGATVITVKLCTSKPEENEMGKLQHINADFRNTAGIKKIMAKLSEHGLPAPWAIILDYLEPFSYGSK
jgi:hypothetical protein